MRLVAFEHDKLPRLGVLTGDTVVDLNEAAPNLPKDLTSMMRAGAQAFNAADAAAKSAKASAHRQLKGLRFLPPIQNPGKIVCLGLNFVTEKPAYPSFFLRCNTSLLAHEEPMVRPLCSTNLDYEAELLVVIGRKARHIDKKSALSVVAGYSCFNDGTVRDYQLRTSQWTIGKNFDKTGSFGPAFVTVDEVPHGGAGLNMKSRLNGKVMQDANLSEMTFPVDETIAILTECLTLEPGDLIAMGTQSSGCGFKMTPPVWMKAGDTIEVEIEGIGKLRNPIVDEAARS